jgi:elongation factor Ts
VLAATDNNKHFGAVVELLCETVFVGKSEVVKTFITEVVTIAVQNKIVNVNLLKSFRTQDNLTIEEQVTDIMGKVGEKIELKYYTIEGENIGFYNHFSNKLSVIACFQNCLDAEIIKNVCMHIAAMNPLALDRDGIGQDIIDKEKDIIKQQITTAKDSTILEKIAKGKLEKFFKENVLVEQPFILDEKISVGDYLKKNNDALITTFKRVEIAK